MKQKKTSPVTAEGTEVQAPAKKKGNKVISVIINIILVVAIVLAAFCTYISFVNNQKSSAPSIFGIIPLSVQTNSMEPTLYQGDLVIDKAIKDPSTIQQGDIITYWTVINGERRLNTHRVVNIYDGGGFLIFETKGDNPQAEVDQLTVHQDEVVGKYLFHWKGVGNFIDFLQQPTGFGLVIVLPVFIFFIYHLIQFFRVLFEYQNIKNRIKYEQERGKAEEVLEKAEDEKEKTRAEIEAELREKLKAELLADMNKEKAEKAEEKAEAPAETPAETPAEEAKND